MLLMLGLSACANRNTAYSNYQPYVVVSYYPPKPVTVVKPVVQPAPTKKAVNPAWERLTYEDLMRFENDCSQRAEQIALLEEQLKQSTFYRIDGVEGNASPHKISKSYYALAKYRIWTLRLACPGGEVDSLALKEALRSMPTAQPTATRCYFEEIADSKAVISSVNFVNGQQNFKRREICTNYPLTPEKPILQIGDTVSFSAKDLSVQSSYPNLPSLRQWRGNLYQVSAKTEMHMNQAVRFTVVSARNSANQWTVVDKF